MKLSIMPVTIFPWIVLAIAAILFLISGDGWYRYPCQDPINFADTSCHPPDCIASETCTDMLINLRGSQ